MKIKKSEFKALIKECLIEILQEGLGGNALPGNTAITSKKSGFPFGGQAGPKRVDADEFESSEEDEETSEEDEETSEEDEETSEEDEETSEEDEETSEEDEETSEEDEETVQEAQWFSRKKKLVKENFRFAPRKPAPKPAPKAPVTVKRNQRLEELTRQVAGSIKGNAKMKTIFEDIFRDTANTTLHEQTQRASVAKAQSEYGMHNVIDANPEEIFEGADRWATLAFKPAHSFTGKITNK